MSSPPIRRVPVWSKPLRLSHWALAGATAVLVLTGWLVRWAPERALQLHDAHFVAAAVLMAALAVRLWLLLAGHGPEQWQALWPNRHRLRQAGTVLRSYVTLGRLPLPRWYAHNPLWAPLYLVLLAVLLAEVASGLLLLDQITLLGGVSVRTLHAWGFFFVLGFAGLHVAASFFHDAKGQADDLSAMVHGLRLFTLEPIQPEGGESSTVVPLHELQRSHPSTDS